MVDIIFAIGIGAVLIFALLCLYALLKAKNRGEQLARAAAINRQQQQNPMRVVALQNMGYTCDPLHDPILDELSFSSIYPDNAWPAGLSRLEVPPPSYDEAMRIALNNSLQESSQTNLDTREHQSNTHTQTEGPFPAPPPYVSSSTSTLFTIEGQNHTTVA